MSLTTVKGNINDDEIGFCHCHEHLFISKGKSTEINKALCIDDLKKTTDELLEFKDAGGKTIVDAQPLGCNRMAGNLVKASEDSGVNIVASTGFHKLVFYPDNHWVFSINENKLADLYIDEINNGMFIDGDIMMPKERIKAKPGIIKVALDKCNLNKEYEKVFTAAAYAAVETKLPMLCHIENGSDANALAKFLLDKGVKNSSIIFCHLDRANYNFNYHEEIAKLGIYLEYDTIGRFKYHSDEKEIALILHMIEKGYDDKLLLGLDTTRERLYSYGGSIGLTYIRKVFIPKLMNFGIEQKLINRLMIENPKRAITN